MLVNQKPDIMAPIPLHTLMANHLKMLGKLINGKWHNMPSPESTVLFPCDFGAVPKDPRPLAKFTH